MPLDFPTSPALNDTYTFSGKTWRWNGEGWQLVNDSSITTTMLANGAVTYSKIQNVTTNKLLGRSTAGSGSVEEISIGTGLSLSTGTLSATGGTGDSTGSLLYLASQFT